MSSADATPTTTQAPTSWRGRLRTVGPAFVLAAGGVGAGDLISALTGSARFGMTLLWAAALGAILKFVATEALGRLYMASGQTILKSIRGVGLWLSVVFMVFLIVMGLVYGAALSSLIALAARAMFPVMPLDAWAIVVAIAAFVILLVGRYHVFERVMIVFAVIMFVGMAGTAAMTLARLDDPAQFTARLAPSIPDGSTLSILAILGGVGGTFGVASYGYWVRDKGWRDPSWIPMMRLDAAVGYLVTFLFAVALFVIGATFLYARGQTIGSEQGLVALSRPLGNELGQTFGWLFLIGFFFVAFSSLVGGWNGLAYLMSDNLRILRKVPDEHADDYISEDSVYFRGALVYCTFPSMALTLTGEPVFLAVSYAAFGALVLPILSIVLLWHLNSAAIDRRYRNNAVSNVVLFVALAIFAVLTTQELIGLFS